LLPVGGAKADVWIGVCLMCREVRKEEQKSMERFKLSPCGRFVGLVGTARKGGGLINVLDGHNPAYTSIPLRDLTVLRHNCHTLAVRPPGEVCDGLWRAGSMPVQSARRFSALVVARAGLSLAVIVGCHKR
jgi:hypothetical protein